jgi:electron transport complex protein RnfE
MGIGMLWTLALLGAMRELLGSGTPRRHRHGFPQPASDPGAAGKLSGFLLAMLPPGAFILLGCMIAWKNWMEARAAQRAKMKPPAPVATAGCH